MSQLLYSLKQAAAAASVSPAVLKRAIHSTDPHAFPPPLAAVRLGSHDRARYRIKHDVLMAWIDSLPDA